MKKETIGIYSHPNSTDTYYIMHIPYESKDKYLKFTPVVRQHIRILIDMAYAKDMPDGTSIDYREYFPEDCDDADI